MAAIAPRRRRSRSRAHIGRLRRDRRPQRTGRNAEAVAEARLAVDDREGQVLGQRRVLQPVVQDERVGARLDRETRAAPGPARPSTARCGRAAAARRRRPLRHGRSDRPGSARPASPRHSRATGRRPACRRRAASARARSPPASCRRRRRRNCRRRSPARRHVRRPAPSAARSPRHRGRRAAEGRARAASAPARPEPRRLHGRRRQKRLERAHRPLDRARLPLDRVAGRARHRAQARRVGEQRDQRIAELLGTRDLERPARSVERRVDVAKLPTIGPCRMAEASLAGSIGFWPPPPANDLPTNTTPARR